MYSFELSEEKKKYGDLARKFAETEILPWNAQFDDDWNTHVLM